jgi:hypothetical protein
MPGKAADGYRLVCDEPVFNFGKVDQSAVITNVFTIRNEGDLTFPFKYLRTSCGCTQGRISKRMIGPGETAEVSVVYTAARRKGPQKKTIWIMPMNNLKPALVLTLTGFVESP